MVNAMSDEQRDADVQSLDPGDQPDHGGSIASFRSTIASFLPTGSDQHIVSSTTPFVHLLESFSEDTSSRALTDEQRSKEKHLSDPIGPQVVGQKKTNGPRKNVYKNQTYADLINQAIESSPEKRLTLSQIYEWLIENIDHFRQRKDGKNAMGWKVGSDLHSCTIFTTWNRVIAIFSTQFLCQAICTQRTPKRPK